MTNDYNSLVKPDEKFRLYEKIVENIKEAVLITKAEPIDFPGHEITFVNQALCDMTGYTKDEIIGKTPRILQGPQTNRQELDRLKESIQNWQATEVEFTNYKKDGSQYQVKFDIFPFADENGCFTHWISIQKDISSDLQNAQSLNDSNSFNQTILESSPDCFKIIDINGRIQFMNTNGLCLMEIDDFGLIKNKPWWDLWGIENIDLVKNAIEKALNGEISEFNAFCNTHKGTPKWWSVMVSPVLSKNGNISQIISVSRDITAFKKDEEILRKTQEKLYGGLKVANVALAEINYTTGIVELSLEAAAMYGFKPDNLSVTLQQFHSTFHPDFIYDLERQIENALNPDNGGIIELEYPIVLPNGVERWLKVYKQFFFNHSFDPSKPLYSILAIQDITNRKQAEKNLKDSEMRFRTLSNSIPQLAWMMDANAWIYWYNQRWFDYTGTTLEEMEGWGWQKVHHPDMVEGVTERFKKAIELGINWEDTFLLKNKEGEYNWFLSRAIPIRNDKGEIVQWFGTNTDVSVQRETEAALNLLNSSLEEKVKLRTEELLAKNLELEQTNAELTSFSYVASHDLQEPLRKIQAFSKRILDTETFSDKTNDYFNRIISAVERMQNLINDLLKFSRTNSTELKLILCDLNEILEESKGYIIETIKDKQAIIESAPLPTIKGIPVLLTQLFTNLIDNAIKYSKPDIKPLILINSKIVKGEDINLINIIKSQSYHCISITDNGIGFEQEYATKIFELFQRLHGRSEYTGTGIGLAICKKIVNRMNGFIKAESTLGVGSTFILYIPVI